ncbi:MAG: hypothetical protein CMO01_28270 [Thalassobius sp.]|nr:hypothetical protein [Thalassovita sp.]
MLQEFKLSDFYLLQEWVTSSELLFRFGGSTFQYPLNEKQIEDYLIVHPDRKFYIDFLEDGRPYAFGEIIPQDNDSVRLGRLLIGNPTERGKGLGVKFVNALLKEAKSHFKVNSVDLFVIKGNTAAIRCYHKVGFSFTEDAPFILSHEGKDFFILKMNILLS